ncbi:unnamed protein product [Closterium sp. NIES-64]|nr:unnamed protein product [Closterium sp. NIES-65]CAI5990694.1 unnamed protein product [Closterium sp. NIES-64]
MQSDWRSPPLAVSYPEVPPMPPSTQYTPSYTPNYSSYPQPPAQTADNNAPMYMQQPQPPAAYSQQNSAYPQFSAPPAPPPQFPQSHVDDYETSVDVVAYDAGGAEPYGARGTGSGAYWGDTPQGFGGGGGSGHIGNSAGGSGPISSPLVDIQMPSLSAGSRGGGEAQVVVGKDGVQSFAVTLLPEPGSSSSPSQVVCKIGLDGMRLQEPGSGRLMRIYPLENITSWEVKEPGVFTFWVRTAVDVSQRPVRLRSNDRTTSLLLDTLTAACIQVFEMVGRDKPAPDKPASASKPSSAPSAATAAAASAAAAAGGAAGAGAVPSVMGWLTRPRLPAADERVHWVPDEEVPKCADCASDFGTFNRRHHCRNCGNIFCDKCTRGRTPLSSEPDAAPVRVCDACLAEVTQRLTNERELEAEGSFKYPSSTPSAAAASGGGTGGSGGSSSGGSSGAGKGGGRSHEQLLRQLQQEMERNASSVPPAVRNSSSSSSARRHSSTSSAPHSAHRSSSARYGGGGGGGGGNAYGSGAPVLSTCSRCNAVALLPHPAASCPTCGAAAAPSPSPPPSRGESAGGIPSGPPHLWPGDGGSMGGSGGGGMGGGGSGGGPRMQQVACPTCTVHLEVQLPASGTETVECGVCQHPFLVAALQ